MRPTQITKKFPENKYHFSTHLTQVGDWVETSPFTNKQEAINVRKAAHFWAWYHKCRVNAEVYDFGEGKWVARVKLISKHRFRDYG